MPQQALLSACAGCVREAQPLGVSGHDLALVIELDLLGELDVRDLHESSLRVAVSPFCSIGVRDDLHCSDWPQAALLLADNGCGQTKNGYRS